MSNIISISMPSDLSEWTSTVTDLGDLSWAAGAGLAGTSGGMSCLIDDTTAIYGQKTITADTSGRVRARFYIDPNALTMGASDGFMCLWLGNSGSATLIRVNLIAGYKFQLVTFRDDGTTNTITSGNYTDVPHYV